MAWRAVGGCTSPYSGYTYDKESLEVGLVSPEVMTAIHDLLDWRSDIAAGNHENGVSATYGLSIQDPFHTYLEATLKRAAFNPMSAGYVIACMVYMHYTAARNGTYDYHGACGEPCSECLEILKNVTAGAGLDWSPKPPPRSFEDGTSIRRLGSLCVDIFEEHGLVKEALGWFQHLISSGEI